MTVNLLIERLEMSVYFYYFGKYSRCCDDYLADWFTGNRLLILSLISVSVGAQFVEERKSILHKVSVMINLSVIRSR